MDLSKALTNSLVRKLEEAIKNLEEGNSNGAANNIQTFINHVDSQTGKAITVEDATSLIAQAQGILAVITP